MRIRAACIRMLNAPHTCVQTVPRIRGILRSRGVLQLLDIWRLRRRPHPVRASAPFPRSRSSSRSSLITCVNKDIATSGERSRTCSETSSRTYAPPSDQDIAPAAVDTLQYDTSSLGLSNGLGRYTGDARIPSLVPTKAPASPACDHTASLGLLEGAPCRCCSWKEREDEDGVEDGGEYGFSTLKRDE